MLSPFKKGIESGFSVLELIIVVSVLSILSSLSIPNINKWVKLSRIDAAKALASITAAECLQSFRTGSEMDKTSPKTETISNDGLVSLGFKINANLSKCSEFYIDPSDQNDTLLYSIGFRINDEGEITNFMEVSYIESTRYMRNQLLRDSDWASMFHSLEVRTPLVDTQLLQKVAPYLLKIREPNKKSMLLKSSGLDHRLQNKILNRPKSGFTTPMSAPSGNVKSGHISWDKQWSREILSKFKSI